MYMYMPMTNPATVYETSMLLLFAQIFLFCFSSIPLPISKFFACPYKQGNLFVFYYSLDLQIWDNFKPSCFGVGGGRVCFKIWVLVCLQWEPFIGINLGVNKGECRIETDGW